MSNELGSEIITTDSEELRHSLFLEENCDELREKFLDLQTLEDLAALLQVSYKQLTYYCRIAKSSLQYEIFEIPKRTGGSRSISAPITPLKLIQRKISQTLYSVYSPKPCVHGFVCGKSIVTNAQAHSKKYYVLNIDLKDFFPSINFGRVRGMFMAYPYFLNANIATALAQICCHDNQLPQGAPSSPIISNMICAKMDSELQKLAKLAKCTYTRYADDLTFSTTMSTFPKILAYLDLVGEELGERQIILGQDLKRIIEDNGFLINQKKIRLQTKYLHQEVTGLTVNKFPNVDRRFIRQIRAFLDAWSKFGIERAEQLYRKHYCSSEEQTRINILLFKRVLRGKIDFLGMVRGRDDKIYLNFLDDYFRLLRLEQNNGL